MVYNVDCSSPPQVLAVFPSADTTDAVMQKRRLDLLIDICRQEGHKVFSHSAGGAGKLVKMHIYLMLHP
ncbi:unnamed protein product [Vitrella brassicaformis CCMP3155]|uniref:Uncharacterized protein n=1 Tax=Vitrella brassicaformis (strain CCMP3155) TaxID=1169540 RepID=A0A0G4ETE3_VITBC|nr:unnamed protein product [Vitrella brassicaformis CCMP3155]|eukprot:CEM00922.1 unnamed protein product [Vitrella brassicaformis CCMP3155]